MSVQTEQSTISRHDFLRLLQHCCNEGKMKREVTVESFVKEIAEKLKGLYDQALDE